MSSQSFDFELFKTGEEERGEAASWSMWNGVIRKDVHREGGTTSSHNGVNMSPERACQRTVFRFHLILSASSFLVMPLPFSFIHTHNSVPIYFTVFAVTLPRVPPKASSISPSPFASTDGVSHSTAPPIQTSTHIDMKKAYSCDSSSLSSAVFLTSFIAFFFSSSS